VQDHRLKRPEDLRKIFSSFKTGSISFSSQIIPFLGYKNKYCQSTDRLTLLQLPENVDRKCSRIELTSTRNLPGNLAFPLFNPDSTFQLGLLSRRRWFLPGVRYLPHNPILLRVLSSTFHSDRLWGTELPPFPTQWVPRPFP
jgi:hypothetical protein